MLYFVLNQDWNRLEDYEFEEIIINTNQNELKIPKSYLLEELNTSLKAYTKNKDFYFYPPKLVTNSNNTIEYVSEFIKNIVRPIIESIKGINILYFPTYRRIEADLNNLGYDDKMIDLHTTYDSLINFGMDDVQKQFDELTHEIEKLSKDGLSKISGEILSQLIKGIPKIDHQFLEKIQAKDIEILLARVGKGISENDKEGIRQLVSNEKKDIKDVYSLFFLQKLIEIYDQQRELDNRIKRFRDVCNKYLMNKKVIYDESKIEIYIKANEADKPLHLSKLSSGEKQIISIFSKVYLSEPEERYIVLFDEPELSLSIFWQRNLLPDIVDSGKCEFLFAVTHSPFIFENKLDKYTTSLGEYFTPLAPELVG